MTVELDWFSPEPDEEVVWTGEPRLWRIWKSGAGALALAVIGIGGAVYLTSDAGGELAPGIAWGAAALFVLAGLANVGLEYLKVEHTDYLLTDRRVYRKDGILSEHVSSLGLDRVQETTLSKDVTGNLFDYGTVAISTAGSGGTDLAMTDLTAPETFRDRLQEQVRQASGRAGEPRPPAGGAGLDEDAVEALLTEARGLRDVAERLEESV